MNDLPKTEIDRDRIVGNARRLVEAGTPVLAVVKADGYGTGAAEIVRAIGDRVEGFCVFRLAEARAARIWQTSRKETIALVPDGSASAEDYLREHVRPAVWTVEQAKRLRDARPVLSVDTGMQRFACPVEQIDAVLAAGECEAAFTHAVRLDQVKLFLKLVGGRGLKLHASGSSLLGEPAAHLDAVRPGLALYRGAVRVSAPLVDVRDSRGPTGYTGFEVARHGVILAGYSNGLKAGVCLVNGRRSRLLEVGMQSAFVEAASTDRTGDEVVLLGDGLEAEEVAASWGCSPQEVIVRLTGAGERSYVNARE